MVTGLSAACSGCGNVRHKCRCATHRIEEGSSEPWRLVSSHAVVAEVVALNGSSQCRFRQRLSRSLAVLKSRLQRFWQVSARQRLSFKRRFGVAVGTQGGPSRSGNRKRRLGGLAPGAPGASQRAARRPHLGTASRGPATGLSGTGVQDGTRRLSWAVLRPRSSARGRAGAAACRDFGPRRWR